MDADEKAFLAKNWWVLTVRGALAILFGIAAVFWPGLTLLTLVYLFSAYILVNGLVSLIGGITSISQRASWVFSVLLGVLQIGVGVYLLRHPQVSFATLILLIGFTLVFVGVFEGISAFADKKSNTSRALMFIGALLYLVAGIVVLFQPVSAGVAFVWILGLVSLINGPILIALSLDAKKAGEAGVVKS